MKIYLAGKVPKGDGLDEIGDWRDVYVNSLPHFEFLTPINNSLDYSKPEMVFGHDCYLIKQADIIIVDGSRKLGAGTSQEMVIAKYFGKYVISVIPHDTHHRKPMKNFKDDTIIKNWIHPFIVSTSDIIYSSAEECIECLNSVDDLSDLYSHVKTISLIDESIETYLKNIG